MKKGHLVILCSTFITYIINAMLYPILSIYARNASNDYIYSGIIVSLPLLVSIIMSFVWGALSDYLGKRKTLVVISGIIGSSMYFIFPFLDITSLIVLRTVQSVFLTSTILLVVIVTEYFPEGKGKAIGNLSMVGGFGSALGGALSGFLIPNEAIGLSTPEIKYFFYLCGISTMFAMLILFFVPESEKKKYRLESSKSFRISNISNIKEINIICFAAIFIAAGGHMIFGIFPAYLENFLNADIKIIGIFMASSSLFGMIAYGLAGKMCDKFSRKKIFTASAISYTVVWFLIGRSSNMLVLYILWSIPVWAFFYTSATAMIADLTEESERGRGIGLLNSVALGYGGFIGAFFSGYLTDSFGFANLSILSSLFAITGLSIGLGIKTKKQVIMP